MVRMAFSKALRGFLDILFSPMAETSVSPKQVVCAGRMGEGIYRASRLAHNRSPKFTLALVFFNNDYGSIAFGI